MTTRKTLPRSAAPSTEIVLKARQAVPPWKNAGVSAPENLPPDHPRLGPEAHIARAMQGFICSFSQRIILGGGVPQQPALLPLVRAKVLAYLNNYVNSEAILEHIDTYIVPPGLGARAGVCGAFALAQQAEAGI